MRKQTIYTVGGTVQAGDGIYIRRQADNELLALCQAGTFAYVLTARQMGKSSLMVGTEQQLAKEGVRTAIVDLTELGVNASAEEWYLGLLAKLTARLRLSTSIVSWWQMYTHLSFTQRLTTFFQEVALTEIAEPIQIFIDEIDSTLSLPFTDDFFAAIRYLYNARALDPDLRRLSFALFGVATPTDLIDEPKRTPFNIGQRVDLSDFTPEEAEPLATGLGLPQQQASEVLDSILAWTGGHPYLTQRLCAYNARRNRDNVSKAQMKSDVESDVASLFYGPMSEQDNNLQFVRDMLSQRAPDPVSVLTTYRAVRQGRRAVYDDERSLAKSHLKLSGVVHQAGNQLRVRNRIYEDVFDGRWIKEQWPKGKIKFYQQILIIITVLTLLIGGFVMLRQRSQRLLLQDFNMNLDIEPSWQALDAYMRDTIQPGLSREAVHQELSKIKSGGFMSVFSEKEPCHKVHFRSSGVVSLDVYNMRFCYDSGEIHPDSARFLTHFTIENDLFLYCLIYDYLCVGTGLIRYR